VMRSSSATLKTLKRTHGKACIAVYRQGALLPNENPLPAAGAHIPSLLLLPTDYDVLTSMLKSWVFGSIYRAGPV
jgi:hypothetical protein